MRFVYAILMIVLGMATIAMLQTEPSPAIYVDAR
jgi:hypothetical protein